MQEQVTVQAEKKPYVKPELITHGSVQELTQTHGHGGTPTPTPASHLLGW